jgi:hypothetical protein
MKRKFEKLRRQAEHCRYLAKQRLAKIVLDAAADLEREALQLQCNREPRAERSS